jgi:hypothetical protein
MKIIKFDLPINGTKVPNLEGLRDNFTTEILGLHASGVLLRWLKSRGLVAEADKLAAIPVEHSDVDKLVVLSEILGMDADRAVIEAALSKGHGNQGVALHAAPEELKYKEKFEKLSALLDELKSKKLYISQDDYNRFVKDKLEIEHEGKIESIIFSKEVLESQYYTTFSFRFNKKLGSVVEAGEAIGEFYSSGVSTIVGGRIKELKSPVRGVLVMYGEYPDMGRKTDDLGGSDDIRYSFNEPICFIRVDHDTAPTIKIISS